MWFLVSQFNVLLLRTIPPVESLFLKHWRQQSGPREEQVDRGFHGSNGGAYSQRPSCLSQSQVVQLFHSLVIPHDSKAKKSCDRAWRWDQGRPFASGHQSV